MIFQNNLMQMKKRKVCVFICGRANYSSLKSLMFAIKKNKKLLLQTVIGSSAVLEKYGNLDKTLLQDGFKINSQFYNNVEGNNPLTMAKSTGLAIIEITNIIEKLKPDIVLIVGDRFEIMSVAIASAYMNIPVAHTMGGEVSGSIDESIRHSITKLSHIHFPSNEDARSRIIKLGENNKYVFNFGCPRIDLIKNQMKKKFKVNTFFQKYIGVGSKIDLSKGYLIVLQHPVTTEFSDSRKHFEITLKAINRIKIPTIMIWPNIDAGADNISKSIRTFREKNNPDWLHIFKNLPPEIFINLMIHAKCLVGNSSAGIRDSGIIGLPVVNIGTRQNNRLRGRNVIDVTYDSEKIFKAITRQLKVKRYKKNYLYGKGDAGLKIAKKLSNIKLFVQKSIAY